MKTIALLVVLGLQFVSMQRGNLTRVEKLNPEELQQLGTANGKVWQAQRELAETQAKIAAAHKMKKENWMEWSTWYEFDGEYIMQRNQNNMTPTN